MHVGGGEMEAGRSHESGVESVVVVDVRPVVVMSCFKSFRAMERPADPERSR